MNASGRPVEDDEVQELLESAGRRPAVPAEDLARIEAAARREWQELVATERRRRLRRRRAVLPAALAASVLLAIAAGWWWTREVPPAPAETVAIVRLVTGMVRVEEGLGGGERERALRPGEASGRERVAHHPAVGEAVAAGAVLATGGSENAGRAALRLAGGESVRLDAGSRVRLVSPARLELMAGALYVDSGRPPGIAGPLPGAAGPLPGAAGALVVGTPYGSVHDIGTQFEVRLGSGAEPALSVRVREGAVALVRGRGSNAVAAGGELRLRRDGRVSRGTVDPQGPAWSWVLAAAPGLDIEGLTLAEYLGWVTRETGWRLRYEDPALAGLAATIRLHGTIEGMAPDESVSVVLPGSGLGYRVERGTLVVTRP